MQIYDVAIFETYAILIGYDAHKVVYHSVYHGFQQENQETHTYFSQPQLITVQLLQQLGSNGDAIMVAMSKGEFKLLVIYNNRANVYCYSYDKMK
jgi:hypothetical protein